MAAAGRDPHLVITLCVANACTDGFSGLLSADKVTRWAAISASRCLLVDHRDAAPHVLDTLDATGARLRTVVLSGAAAAPDGACFDALAGRPATRTVRCLRLADAMDVRVSAAYVDAAFAACPGITTLVVDCARSFVGDVAALARFERVAVTARGLSSYGWTQTALQLNHRQLQQRLMRSDGSEVCALVDCSFVMRFGKIVSWRGTTTACLPVDAGHLRRIDLGGASAPLSDADISMLLENAPGLVEIITTGVYTTTESSGGGDSGGGNSHPLRRLHILTDAPDVAGLAAVADLLGRRRRCDAARIVFSSRTTTLTVARSHAVEVIGGALRALALGGGWIARETAQRRRVLMLRWGGSHHFSACLDAEIDMASAVAVASARGCFDELALSRWRHLADRRVSAAIAAAACRATWGGPHAVARLCVGVDCRLLYDATSRPVGIDEVPLLSAMADAVMASQSGFSAAMAFGPEAAGLVLTPAAAGALALARIDVDDARTRVSMGEEPAFVVVKEDASSSEDGMSMDRVDCRAHLGHALARQMHRALKGYHAHRQIVNKDDLITAFADATTRLSYESAARLAADDALLRHTARALVDAAVRAADMTNNTSHSCGNRIAHGLAAVLVEMMRLLDVTRGESGDYEASIRIAAERCAGRAAAAAFFESPAGAELAALCASTFDRVGALFGAETTASSVAGRCGDRLAAIAYGIVKATGGPASGMHARRAFARYAGAYATNLVASAAHESHAAMLATPRDAIFDALRRFYDFCPPGADVGLRLQECGEEVAAAAPTAPSGTGHARVACARRIGAIVVASLLREVTLGFAPACHEVATYVSIFLEHTCIHSQCST